MHISGRGPKLETKSTGNGADGSLAHVGGLTTEAKRLSSSPLKSSYASRLLNDSKRIASGNHPKKKEKKKKKKKNKDSFDHIKK